MGSQARTPFRYKTNTNPTPSQDTEKCHSAAVPDACRGLSSAVGQPNSMHLHPALSHSYTAPLANPFNSQNTFAEQTTHGLLQRQAARCGRSPCASNDGQRSARRPKLSHEDQASWPFASWPAEAKALGRKWWRLRSHLPTLFTGDPSQLPPRHSVKGKRPLPIPTLVWSGLPGIFDQVLRLEHYPQWEGSVKPCCGKKAFAETPVPSHGTRMHSSLCFRNCSRVNFLP